MRESVDGRVAGRVDGWRGLGQIERGFPADGVVAAWEKHLCFRGQGVGARRKGRVRERREEWCAAEARWNPGGAGER